MSSITVGIVGAGGIASAHLPAWQQLGVEVIVFSIDGNAPALVEQHGGRVVSSLDELLAASDIVDICTPTDTHREIVERAAAAGRDVICEKPLGLTREEAEAMLASCKAAGVRLIPGHIVRYFPEYAPMHEAIASGAIGRVAVQRFTRIGSRPVKAWFHDRSRSGGIILDQMIHDIDFARWNAGEVTEVFARERVGGADGVTTAQVTLTHESGAITTLMSGWGAVGTTFRTQYSVAGDQGYLEHDSAARSPLRLDTPGAGDEGGGLLPRAAYTESPFVTELRDFLRAIVSGDAARVSAVDGIAAIAIAEAANESARTGVPVRVEPRAEEAGA